MRIFKRKKKTKKKRDWVDGLVKSCSINGRLRVEGHECGGKLELDFDSRTWTARGKCLSCGQEFSGNQEEVANFATLITGTEIRVQHPLKLAREYLSLLKIF